MATKRSDSGWASAGWASVTPKQLKEAGITPEQFNLVYKRATLYQAEQRKDGFWLVVSATQKRPFVKR